MNQGISTQSVIEYRGTRSPQTEGREEASEPTYHALSIVMPAYNEEAGVGAQIEAIRQVMNDHGIEHEIVVVDDGSADATAEKAYEAGARVLQHPCNRGYGASLKTGIRAAQYETVAIIDADGTYPADALPIMLDKARTYDMVVGARTGENVAVPLSRRPAKWFLRTLASYVARQRIPDLNSGLRVMKKSVVDRFDFILPSGFSFTTTITLSMLCNDYLVYYHPIDYHRRVGRSKIRPVDAYHFLLLILRTIVFFNPLRIFLPLGTLLFVAGLGKFIYDIFLDNLSETAVLGLLGAFIVWTIGLLSDQIARIGFGMRSRESYL